jgi:hypothetical protein
VWATLRYRVIEFEPDRRITLHGSSRRLEATDSMTFVDTESGGTMVT